MPRLGRPPLYPWTVWLDGKERFLQPGQDFHSNVNVRSLRSQTYNEAARRGLKVSCRFYADGLVVKAGGTPAPRRGGRRGLLDWDEVFSGNPVTLHSQRDFPGGIKGARKVQDAAYRAARRRGVSIRTMTVGDNERAQITIVAKVSPAERREEAETFPPPILVDEGINEDSTFPLRDWDGNIVEEPKAEKPKDDHVPGSEYVTIAELQKRHGITPQVTPTPASGDDDELPDLDHMPQWEEPSETEVAEAERLAAEHG